MGHLRPCDCPYCERLRNLDDVEPETDDTYLGPNEESDAWT